MFTIVVTFLVSKDSLNFKPPAGAYSVQLRNILFIDVDLPVYNFSKFSIVVILVFANK